MSTTAEYADSAASTSPGTASVARLRAGAHLPALDGIRGLAILAVLIDHFGPGIVTGVQWLDVALNRFFVEADSGVDLFFVLSGFLITGILLKSSSRPHYFRNFYMRRTLRIFPLYYGVLFVIFVMAPAVQPVLHKHPATLQHSQFWMWTYCFNILVARLNSFDVGHILGLMLPYWSLCVEEQFYLIWPALVYVATPRRMLWLCTAVIAAAIGLRIYWSLHYPPPQLATFVMLPFRMDSLATGGLVACVFHFWGARPALRSAALPVALVTGAIVIYGICIDWINHPEYLIWYGRYSVLSLLAAALIVRAVASPAQAPINRALGAGWLRFLGRYSYGIYIYHFIVLCLARGPLDRALARIVHASWLLVGLEKVILIGLSILIAVASFQWYEQPFLSLKRYFEPDRSPTRAPLPEAA